MKNIYREIEVLNEAAWAEVIPVLLSLSEARKVWLLEGDLGSGKTTLAKYLIEHLSGESNVSSPTFSLVNEYTWKIEEEERRIYHLDLYRLESPGEAFDIGLDEILLEGDLVLIEWPAIAESMLPDDCFRLKIKHDNNHRKVLVL